MGEILMHKYYKHSDSEEDSDCSNNSLRTPPDFSELLKELGYPMQKELKQGATGREFLVNDTDEDPYVVKQMNYRDKKELVTIQKEVKILKTLKHVYIVSYKDSFEDEAGHYCLVKEYYAGDDLFKRMQTQKVNGVFEEQQILDWFVQICLALQYLDEKNILHRDIKPQNIYLTEDGYINLDVGWLNSLESADSHAESDLYASPEVFQKECNSKSDIWSLGWLLHDLCMLDVWPDIIERRYLHAVSMRGTPPHISERYSEELRELIRQMLSRDPEDRPSAHEILAKPFLNDAVKRNALKQRIMESFKTFNEAYNEHYEDFKSLVKQWGETTDSLEEIHRKCTIGSLSGSVTGAAGGITALVGAILAPFTFGASLIVAGVGVGVGVAGGVTGTASIITDIVQQKTLCESLEKIQQNCKNVSEAIFNSLNPLRRVLRKHRDFPRNLTFDNEEIPWNFDKTKLLYPMNFAVLANVGRLAAQTARVARAAAAAAAGVLNGLLVILDVFSIVNDAVDIHQMNPEKVKSRFLKGIAEMKVKSRFLKGIAEMRKTHTELCNALDAIKQIREEIKSQG